MNKLRQRFGRSHAILVGEPGILNQARLQPDHGPAQAGHLAPGGTNNIQTFDEQGIAEVISDDYPRRMGAKGGQ